MPHEYLPSSEDRLQHSETYLSEWERGHIWPPARTRRSTSNHSTRDGAESPCSSQSRRSRYASRDSSVGNSHSRDSSLSMRSQKGSSLKSHGHRDCSRHGGSTGRASTCQKQGPVAEHIFFCPEPPFSRDAESEGEEDEEDEEEDEETRYGVRYPDNSRTAIGPESFMTTPNSDRSIEPATEGERHQSGEPEDQWDEEDDEAARYQAKAMSAREYMRLSREHRAEPGYRPPKHRTQRASRDA